jgi:hypothetical protein
MKPPECTEGSKALENFESMATAIFKAPKTGGRKTRKSLAKRLAKTSRQKLPIKAETERVSFEDSLPKELASFCKCKKC